MKKIFTQGSLPQEGVADERLAPKNTNQNHLAQESRFTVFLRQLQTDLKGFVWFNVLFFLFRVAFILIFGSRLAQGLFSADTFTSLWLGLRMSLKTAGAIMLIGAVLSTVPKLFFLKWKADTIRYYWYVLCNFVFTI